MRSAGAGLARATSLTIVQTLRLAVSMTCCMDPDRSMQNTMSTLVFSWAHRASVRAAIRFMGASISFAPLTRALAERFHEKVASPHAPPPARRPGPGRPPAHRRAEAPLLRLHRPRPHRALERH